MRTIEVDVLVIGAGVAGRRVAKAVAGAGREVAVVERRAYGGTCELRGCEPKKVLWEAAHAVDAGRRLAGHGVREAPSLDWEALVRFERSFVDPVPEAAEGALRDAGARTLHGEAQLVAPDAAVVRGSGEETRVAFRHAVVAVGARPVPPPFDGADHLVTSDALLSRPTLPDDVTFVGGGYVSMELAFVAAAAGARVRVLERGARPLGAFDPEVVDALLEGADARGVGVVPGCPVSRVEATGDGYLVRGDERSFHTDLVVHGAGRGPDLDALDPAAAGLEGADGRLVVDERMRCAGNPRVRAAGDAAAPGLPLTPVASAQADVVIDDLIGDGAARFDPGPVPSVAFTHPPIARVGATREALSDAIRRGDVHARHVRADGWRTAARSREPVYAATVLVEPGADRVRGACVAGPHAEETIHLFAVALREDVPASRLRSAVYAFPTSASDLPALLR